MKRLSLQWRVALMTIVLISLTCIAMKLLLCSSGVRYMDSIGESLQGCVSGGEPIDFDPETTAPDQALTIIIHGTQKDFCMTNWYVAAMVTLLVGILAYFVSGRTLKPLRSFASQVEQIQMSNLSDTRLNEDMLPEFRQLSHSFNLMLERMDHAFAAQRQFTGNAAHELRTPLSLMQAQLELFSAEHPHMSPETAKFLSLLREQTERLTEMTKTLLEMSSLHSVPRDEHIRLGPMVEEIFTDLAPAAEKRELTLIREGDGVIIGNDALIYRLLFNLTENAIKYNRRGGTVHVSVSQMEHTVLIRVADTGFGIPEEYQQSIFEPFFRVEQSRSRKYGGAGLGLSLVWAIADLHGGAVQVAESSASGTVMTVRFPAVPLHSGAAPLHSDAVPPHSDAASSALRTK